MRLIILAAGILAATTVSSIAADARCKIEVQGRTYLDEICEFTPDPDGSFSIGTGERKRSKYFAMVQVDEGGKSAMAYWNGSDAASHAHDELGAVKRQGACWVNDRAKICAWKP